MKNLWKYVLLGFLVAFVYTLFVANFGILINGVTLEAGITLASGIFLSSEIAICTSVIFNAINKNNDRKE